MSHIKAPFSKRIVEGTEVEVIGGADKYVAACRACFMMPSHMIPAVPETPPPAFLLGARVGLVGGQPVKFDTKKASRPSTVTEKATDDTTNTVDTTDVNANRQLFPSEESPISA